MNNITIISLQSNVSTEYSLLKGKGFNVICPINTLGKDIFKLIDVLINSETILFIHEEPAQINNTEYNFAFGYVCALKSSKPHLRIISIGKDYKLPFVEAFNSFQSYYKTLDKDKVELMDNIYEKFVKYVAAALWQLGPKEENEKGCCEMTISKKQAEQFFKLYKIECNIDDKTGNMRINYTPRVSHVFAD